jgi:hypothetical protein
MEDAEGELDDYDDEDECSCLDLGSKIFKAVFAKSIPAKTAGERAEGVDGVVNNVKNAGMLE